VRFERIRVMSKDHVTLFSIESLFDVMISIEHARWIVLIEILLQIVDSLVSTIRHVLGSLISAI
jgi:hypothetical protein